MTALRLFTSLLALIPIVALHAADAPLYKNDFEAAALDKEPEGMLITAGDFKVKAEGSGKVLELPGEPLDTARRRRRESPPARASSARKRGASSRPLG
jgi:hypothetical protein